MADTDGGVKLGLHFDFDGIKKDINTLQRDLQTVSKNAANIYKNAGDSVNSYSGKLAKINEQLIRQSNAVKILSDEMLRMLSGDVEPKSITTLQKELIAAQKELANLDKEVEKLGAEQQALADKNITIGGISSLTPQELARFKELDQLIIDNGNRTEQTENKIASLDEKLTNLRLNPQLTPEFDVLLAKLTEADAKMSRLQGDLDAGTAPTPPTPDAPIAGTGKFAMIQAAAQKILPLLIQVGNAAKRAGNNLLAAFKNATSHIKIFNKDLNLGNNIVNKFMKRIKNMAINTFIFFQIRKAIRAMFASFADGFKQYAKFDKEFGNSIKNLKNTGVQLGNSIAAGFIPLIQALLPYLQQLVELMTKAADKMAQFIAALSGKQVYTKAKQVQDLKDGLDEVAESADAAKGSLAGFDQLNVQSMSKEDDTKDYFETAPIDSSILDTVAKLSDLLDPLLNKLKEMKLDLADAFKNVIINFKLGDWSNLFTPITDLLKKWLNDIDWAAIQKAAYNLGVSLGQVLNSIFADNLFADAIGHTIAELLNTALWFAYGFLTTFNFTQFGTFIGTGINAVIRDFDWNLLAFTLAAGINGAIDASLALVTTVNFARLGAKIGESLTLMLTNIDWSDIGNLIATSINQAFNLIQGFLNNYEVGSLAKGLSETINTLFKNVDAASAGDTISQLITSLFNEVIIFLDTVDWTMIGIRIGEFLGAINWLEIFSKVVNVITKAIGAAGAILIGFIIGLVKELLAQVFGDDAWNIGIEAITKWFNDIQKRVAKKVIDLYTDFKKSGKSLPQYLWDGFWEGVKTLWGKVNEWVDIHIVTPFMDAIYDLFDIHSPSKVMEQVGINIIQGMIDGISSLLNKAKEKFTEIKDTAVEKFDTLKTSISESLENTKNDFTEKWDIIKTAVSLAGEDMQTSWNDTKDKLTEKASEMATSIQEKLDVLKDGAKEKFDTLKSNIVSLFAALPNGIKDPLDNVITMVENLINRLIDGFNLLSAKLGTFKIDVPDWVPEIGGTKYSLGLPTFQHITLPRLPALAQGAVIPPTMSEFIARLGDNNKETEIVSPLSTMKQAFMEALSEMDFSTNVNVYLEGDADGVFKLVRTENNKWKKQHAGAGAF